MDLNTGKLIWVDTFPDPPSYPSLTEDVQCDVVVLGGGEAGVLSAWQLMCAGLSVVMIEKYRIGQGSTAANTGLLQYFNDTPLHLLAKQHGQSNAVRLYTLCKDAVERIGDIARRSV